MKKVTNFATVPPILNPNKPQQQKMPKPQEQKMPNKPQEQKVPNVKMNCDVIVSIHDKSEKLYRRTLHDKTWNYVKNNVTNICEQVIDTFNQYILKFENNKIRLLLKNLHLVR